MAIVQKLATSYASFCEASRVADNLSALKVESFPTRSTEPNEKKLLLGTLACRDACACSKYLPISDNIYSGVRSTHLQIQPQLKAIAARLRVQITQSYRKRRSHGLVPIAIGSSADAQPARIEPIIRHLCPPTRGICACYWHERDGRCPRDRFESHQPGPQSGCYLVSKPEASINGHDRSSIRTDRFRPSGTNVEWYLP